MHAPCAPNLRRSAASSLGCLRWASSQVCRALARQACCARAPGLLHPRPLAHARPLPAQTAPLPLQLPLHQARCPASGPTPPADIIGRMWGSRLASSIMLLGSVLLTSCAGSDAGFLVFFLVALCILGIGERACIEALGTALWSQHMTALLAVVRNTLLLRMLQPVPAVTGQSNTACMQAWAVSTQLPPARQRSEPRAARPCGGGEGRQSC